MEISGLQHPSETPGSESEAMEIMRLEANRGAEAESSRSVQAGRWMGGASGFGEKLETDRPSWEVSWNRIRGNSVRCIKRSSK